jgi:hypothetical protein
MIDNGIQTGSAYQYRTNYWKESSGSTYRSLVDWYIHDRYQLYNRNRRELSGDVRYLGYLKPLSMWNDTYDPSLRQYILTSYDYDLDSDIYKCTWLEYDNNSVITINGTGEAPPPTVIIPAAVGTSSRRTGERTTTRTTEPSTRPTRPSTLTSGSSGRR